MSGSVMITVGYPHELLGHLRRLEGAGDINFLPIPGVCWTNTGKNIPDMGRV